MGKKKPRKGGDDDWENDVEQMEAGDAPEVEPTKFKGLIFPHLLRYFRSRPIVSHFIGLKFCVLGPYPLGSFF